VSMRLEELKTDSITDEIEGDLNDE
jgi:hypothetical protein